jgi:hypothetical protein
MTITLEEFNGLLDKMRSSDKLKSTKNQLVCASELVFHGGVTLREIPQLTIGDVLNHNDEIVQQIDKFDKNITVNEKSKTALRDYLKTPKERNPNLNGRIKPLFPGYKNTQKLQKHWEKFGTEYRELLKSGIRSHYLTCRENQMTREDAIAETANQFRHTPRSIEANVTGNMIPAGNAENFGAEIVWLADQADYLSEGASYANLTAIEIMDRLDKIYEKTSSAHLKSQIEGLRDSYFLPRLSRFLGQKAAGPAASIPNPSNVSNPDTSSSN